MTIGEHRVDCLKMMCDGFKFIEEVAGNTSLIGKDGMGGPDDTRTDDVEASDVISAARLIFRTYQKEADREKQKRQIRINSQL
jgi:hypothetical protein